MWSTVRGVPLFLPTFSSKMFNIFLLSHFIVVISTILSLNPPPTCRNGQGYEITALDSKQRARFARLRRDKCVSLVGSRRPRGFAERLSNASAAAANASVPAPANTITCGDGARTSSTAEDLGVLEQSRGVFINRDGSDSSGGRDNDRSWEHRQAFPTHGTVGNREVCMDLLGSSTAVWKHQVNLP